jgi:hypothetical protein
MSIEQFGQKLRLFRKLYALQVTIMSEVQTKQPRVKLKFRFQYFKN